MKLVYQTPSSSGLNVVDCKNIKDIEKTLKKLGIDKDNYFGEVVYYVFIGSDGKHIQKTLDYT